MAATVKKKIKRCLITLCMEPGTHQLFDSRDRLWGDVCIEHAYEGAKYIDWWEMIEQLQKTSLHELCPPLPDEVKSLGGMSVA